ncbi:MAG TPA: DUF748 domain-containing protein [Sedimentisphaerales bacterium]|jgi:hypothetical protein|nr:DUF748 domain-containing protein [Sedimentisphaerales bacterium]HNU29763.1 DUF748 domain-containing protein [Sedimentisphaerales bacterium]
MMDTRESRKRKQPKKWPRVLAGAFVLILLVVLLTPVALSSQGFARWLGGRIGSAAGGQANIGDLSIGWLKGVRVADFSFRGQDGWAQVDIGRIATRPRLAGLLGGNLALSDTVIDEPKIAIDLRHMPPSTDEEPASIDMAALARLSDVVVRNGSLELTDTGGRTVRLAGFDSTVNMRPAGQTSRFAASSVVTQADVPGRVALSGEITPDRREGWSLKGTSGNLTVEVNDLDLSAIAPFLEMAGVQVQAKGVLSADLRGAIQDGRIESVNAKVVGRDLHVMGEALQGDHLHTSQLDVQAGLTQTSDGIQVDRLSVRADWASLSATGRLPTTVQSMTDLLKSDASYLTGQFDVDLATVLSQMPKTIGVQEGMVIQGGRATGTIDTTTANGRATLVAETQIAGLAGKVNDKQVSLSKPLQATLRLSTDDKGNSQLEGLNVSAPFAQVTAGGDFEQIQYKAQIDLASLQKELGPFVDLGAYGISGQLSSTGKVSIEEGLIGAAGSLSARQLVLTAPDGNSVSEQATSIDFALGLNQKDQVVTVDTLSATTGFGEISIAKTSIPLAQDANTPLNVTVSARDIRLAALKPYAVMFASFPEELGIEGVAQSQLALTRQNSVYHLATDDTKIQDFTLTSPAPENKTFKQRQVTAQLDVYFDPARKTIDRANWLVKSPQVTMKGQLVQTSQAGSSHVQGTIDGDVDWTGLNQAASAFMPETLDIAGQRQVSFSFASTYPADDPNGFLQNLDGTASLGFDRAAYKGLNFDSTQIDLQVTKGSLQIKPFTTTVNEGKVNFAAQADLRQTPILLKTSGPLQVAQGVRITSEMTESFLKYVNPIFADAVGASGVVNFNTRSLTIPLTGTDNRSMQLDGTIGIQQLRLQASLLNKILSVIKESVRDQILTIQPTKLVLQNGTLRYENMQVDVGDNPVTFSGAIGLDERLDMTVLLPYTFEGRTVRVGDKGQESKRVSVPLTGTLSAPQLNIQRLLETQILQGFGELIKRL